MFGLSQLMNWSISWRPEPLRHRTKGRRVGLHCTCSNALDDLNYCFRSTFVTNNTLTTIGFAKRLNRALGDNAYFARCLGHL